MSDRWNPDLMLLDSIHDANGATFFGIDWGRKDWTGISCPSCHMPHRWRKRLPKHCRHCGLRFSYTASEHRDGQ